MCGNNLRQAGRVLTAPAAMDTYLADLGCGRLCCPKLGPDGALLMSNERRVPGVAPLPACPQHNPLRVELLKQLHRFRWISDLRFADQKVEVIRHNDVAEYNETTALAHLFQDG